MKKRFCLFAALAAMVLVGCKKEQSELDFSNIQDKAVVTGYVTYSVGIDTLSNDYVAEVIKPATGKMVYIDVPKSAYQAGTQGNKRFEAAIDSTGHFSIEVPVKSDGISGATLRYEEFTAERATYLKMENGKPVFEVRMCRFETPAAVTALPTLMPGSNKIGDENALRYEYAVIDMKDYSEKAIFSGKLLLPYEVSYKTGAYKDAADCKVEITIQDGEDVEEVGFTDATEFTYGTTTNTQGEFSLNLPIKNLRKGFYIKEVVVVPTANTAFTHYVDLTGKSVSVSGAYLLREATMTDGNVLDNIAVQVAEVTEGISCAIGTVPLKFKPGYVNGIVDGVEPPVWSNDLAGWVFGEYAFRNLQGKATLTGSVALAQEDAFGIGSYAKGVQSITITGSNAPYDRAFEVLTEADGTFAFDILVEQDDINPGTTFSVDLVQPASIAFTHYATPTKTMVLKEGYYTETYRLRPTDADWNEMGDYYYTFQPANTPSSYSSELAGWFKAYDNDQIYTATQTITARIFVGIETAYATGAYVGAEGYRAVATVDYGIGINGSSSSVDVVAPITADGTFTVTIPAKSSTSTYTADEIHILYNDKEIDTYKHFIKGGKERTLAGSYNESYRFESKDAEWNNKYTIYYTFTPSAPTSTFHSRLAGWFKKANYNTTLTATGKAFFGVEKSFGVGEFQPAKDEIIAVRINELGTTFQVPVQADGTFSVPIPALFDTDEYTLTTSAAATTIDDFIHYRAEGKKMQLSGSYETNTDWTVKPADAAWNNMGTIYFKFRDNGTTPTYTQDLAGWLVVPANFTNTDKTATGTVKIATETGFWRGTYTGYANKRVSVQYSLNGEDIKQVVLTDQDGAYSCTIYRQFSDDAPSVSTRLLDGENITDYVHYYHITSPTAMKIEGEYTFYLNDKPANASWEVMGTDYYKFQPNTTPEDWTDNLVGWYIVPQKKGTANFKLYAQKAYLTADANNHEAKWNDAGAVKATVTVDGNTFHMPVSGHTLTFSMPTDIAIEEGSTQMAVTVRLANQTSNSTAFTYYEKSNEPASTTIMGNYQDAGNISNKQITAAANNTFELKESAKYIFVPNSTPTGWYSYTWNIADEI